MGTSNPTGRGKGVSRIQFSEEFNRKALEEYRQFLRKRDDERKEKRLQQALALQQREDEQKRKEEEKRVTEIGDAAILQYKSHTKEQEEKAEREEKRFKDSLQRVLAEAGVEDDKISLALEGMTRPSNAKFVLPDTVDLSVPAQAVPGLEGPTAAIPEQKSMFSRYCQDIISDLSKDLTKTFRMFRRGRHSSGGDTTMMSDCQAGRVHSHFKVEEKSNVFEAWVLSHSNHCIHFAPISAETLSQMFAAQKSPEKRKSLLKQFALLDVGYQSQILRLCQDRLSQTGYHWKLIYLKEVRERKKTGRWNRAKVCTHIQVVLVQQRNETEPEFGNGSPTGPQERNDDTPPPASKFVSTNPLLTSESKGLQKAESQRPPSHSYKQETVPENVINHNRKQMQGLEGKRERVATYYYADRYGYSDGPLLAEVVEELLYDTTGKEIWSPVKTKIFKDAIDTEVVRDSGHNFVEDGDKIVLTVGLSGSELVRLHEQTKHNRAMVIFENGRNAQISGEQVTRNPHMAWNIPPPRFADTNDSFRQYGDTRRDLLAYQRPCIDTSSQPGRSRSVVSKHRSRSPPTKSVGKELVKYGHLSPSSGRYLARDNESQRLHRRYEETSPVAERSMVRFSSPHRSRLGSSMFLDERTESPRQYSGDDFNSRRPRYQSTRRGRCRSPLRGYESASDSFVRSSRGRSWHEREVASTTEQDYHMERPRSRERLRTMSSSQPRSYERDPPPAPVQSTGHASLRSKVGNAEERRIPRVHSRTYSRDGMPCTDDALDMAKKHYQTVKLAEDWLGASTLFYPRRRKAPRRHDSGDMRRRFSTDTETETTSEDEIEENIVQKQRSSSFDEELNPTITRDAGADMMDEDESPEQTIDEHLAQYGSLESLKRVLDVSADAKAEDSATLPPGQGSSASAAAEQANGDKSGAPHGQEAIAEEGETSPVVVGNEATKIPVPRSPKQQLLDRWLKK